MKDKSDKHVYITTTNVSDHLKINPHCIQFRCGVRDLVIDKKQDVSDIKLPIIIDQNDVDKNVYAFPYIGKEDLVINRIKWLYTPISI